MNLETLTDNSIVYVMIKLARRMTLVYQMQPKGKKRDKYWLEQIIGLDFEDETQAKQKLMFGGKDKDKKSGDDK